MSWVTCEPKSTMRILSWADLGVPWRVRAAEVSRRGRVELLPYAFMQLAA